MTCGICQATGLTGGKDGVRVCWCGLDLCPACIERHTPGCKWYAAMKTKAEKDVKPPRLPKVKRRRR